jgi:hypothetical protein
VTASLALGLALALASAAALNWGFFTQHGAAATLPPLRLRAPVGSLRALFTSKRWMRGFITGLFGWALYIVALALAPLSLVQAVSAGGVGVLALLVWRGAGVRPRTVEVQGIGLAIGGLVLLAVSLAGEHAGHAGGSSSDVASWLGLSALVALLAGLTRSRAVVAGAEFGVAAGVLYAGGDVATKAATLGIAGAAFVPAILAFHGSAFGVLQLGFQRGEALATAGLATLFTNAVPIAAGMTIFHEPMPSGVLGIARVAAFAAVVAGAAFLARPAGEDWAHRRRDDERHEIRWRLGPDPRRSP